MTKEQEQCANCRYFSIDVFYGHLDGGLELSVCRRRAPAVQSHMGGQWPVIHYDDWWDEPTSPVPRRWTGNLTQTNIQS